MTPKPNLSRSEDVIHPEFIQNCEELIEKIAKRRIENIDLSNNQQSDYLALASVLDVVHGTGQSWLSEEELIIASCRDDLFRREFKNRPHDYKSILEGGEMFSNFLGYAIVKAKSFSGLWDTMLDVKKVINFSIDSNASLSMYEAFVWKYAALKLTKISQSGEFSSVEAKNTFLTIFKALETINMYKAHNCRDTGNYDEDMFFEFQNSQKSFSKIARYFEESLS